MILSILIYLSGCILSALRLAAMEYSIDEYYLPWLEPRYNSISEVIKHKSNFIFFALSWIGFFGGAISYLIGHSPNEKFFIYSYKFKKHD
jgi:hypothetical protein